MPLPSTSQTTPEDSSTDSHKIEKDKEPSPTLSTGPASPTPGPQKLARKKRKPQSPWQAFLAALGCASKAAQEDTFEDEKRESISMSEKAPVHRQGEKLKRKFSNRRPSPLLQQQQASQTESHVPLIPPVPSLNGQDASTSVTASTSASTPRAQETLSQEMTANSSRMGVLLPKEETEDVLSGAVVPPGADGHTPQGTPRKRRSRMSNRAASESPERTGDQDSVSGGSEHEGDGSSGDQGGSGSEEEEDDFMDDQDEEDRIIAQGGIGIPIGEVRLVSPFSLIRSECSCTGWAAASTPSGNR